jgi:hypothetical protein
LEQIGAGKRKESGMSSESNRQQDGQKEQTSKNQPQPSLFSMFSNMTRLAYQPVDLPAVEGLVQSLDWL